MPSETQPAAWRAVLFDATGTLIELREKIGETYARFGRAHGVEISAWRLGQAFGRLWLREPLQGVTDTDPEKAESSERAAWCERVRQTFLSADSAERPADLEACSVELYEHYGSARAWRPKTGAAATLRALHEAGVATAVVSNFDRRLPEILAELGLAEHLDRVLLPSDVGVAKPDPRIFRVALEGLGAPAEGSLFVGDDAERDFPGARAAGLHTIDVRTLATLEDLVGDSRSSGPQAAEKR